MCVAVFLWFLSTVSLPPSNYFYPTVCIGLWWGVTFQSLYTLSLSNACPKKNYPYCRYFSPLWSCDSWSLLPSPSVSLMNRYSPKLKKINLWYLREYQHNKVGITLFQPKDGVCEHHVLSITKSLSSGFWGAFALCQTISCTNHNSSTSILVLRQ